jgi:hypothetical protein
MIGIVSAGSRVDDVAHVDHVDHVDHESLRASAASASAAAAAAANCCSEPSGVGAQVKLNLKANFETRFSRFIGVMVETRPGAFLKPWMDGSTSLRSTCSTCTTVPTSTESQTLLPHCSAVGRI